MIEQKKEPSKMNFKDDPAETDSGMYLSLLAENSEEAEAALVLNSLVDDRDKLNQEAEKLIDAAKKLDFKNNNL